MRRIFYVIAALVVFSGLAGLAAKNGDSANAQTAGRTRIGVFDSRCVALAYYRTPEFQNEMKQMRTDLAAARAAGNTNKVSELEYAGPAMQNLLHYQVFSNASIPNVIEKISPALAKIAADARVSVLVSRWDVAFKDAGVDYVDVTDALVKAINSDPQIQQMASAAKSQTPMPLVQAVKTLRPDR